MVVTITVEGVVLQKHLVMKVRVIVMDPGMVVSMMVTLVVKGIFSVEVIIVFSLGCTTMRRMTAVRRKSRLKVTVFLVTRLVMSAF